MPTFDATSADCYVFTFKEGLLSAVAHDLKLRVTRFQVQVSEGPAVDARFEASSLRVVAAMRDGAEAPGALSAKDVADIEGNVAADVLQPMRYPQIRFVSSEVERRAEDVAVRGTLTIKDRSRPVTLHARRSGVRMIAETTLHQPDFGIKPFTAMFGTLRIKPDIRVRIELPALQRA